MADNQLSESPLFDPNSSDATEVIRRVFLRRLREDPSFRCIQPQRGDFYRYVTFATQRDDDRESFDRLVVDVFWQLVVHGIVAPGTKQGEPSPPHFHLTQFGKKVLADPSYDPHEPTAYLQELGQTVPNPDATVLAYLREALNCFSHGTFVASAMMLGIASERAFLLVCESLLNALKDPSERSAFQNVFDRNPMKPKLDWVTQKFPRIQGPPRPAGWPEDVDIKNSGVFNLIRCQRNDLGHPRPAPPSVTRDDAFGFLRIFPSYYATTEAVREFLAKNQV